MYLPVKELEEFGLTNFINTHRHVLCTRTVNHLQVAAFLRFDAGQIATIYLYPDNFSRTEKLYKFIQQRVTSSNFLEALEETGNEHVIKFIQSVLPRLSSSGQLPSVELEISPKAKTRNNFIWFNIPEPTESFYGREYFLFQLHEKLQQHGEPVQLSIISGLCGIGKTETARRYIMKHGDSYNNIIWINAQNANSMKTSFLQLASDLEIPVENSEGKSQSREIQEIVKEICNKICEGEKSNLIIFDNAEDYQSCQQFLPVLSHPRMKEPVILATSRNQEWTSSAGPVKIQVLPLDVLTENESLDFILNQLDSDSPELREESQELIQLIGGLPLALKNAVTYIKKERKESGRPYNINDYAQKLKLQLGMTQTTSISDSNCRWSLAIEKIQSCQNGGEAVKILEFLSFLHPDKIPMSFLCDLTSEIEDNKFNEALNLLENSLAAEISINKTESFLSINRQLQLFVRQRVQGVQGSEEPKVVVSLVEKCNSVLSHSSFSQPENGDEDKISTPQNPAPVRAVTEEALFCVVEFAKILHHSGNYKESVELMFKIFAHRENVIKAKHSAVVDSEKRDAYDCKNVRVLFINQKFDSPGKSKKQEYKEKKRDGADVDGQYVKTLFEEKLGMKLEVEENIESTEVLGILKKFKRKCTDEENDGCILIISTHGLDPHFLLMDDLNPINLEKDVIQQFGRDKFEEFDGRPKIFLFNACRASRTSQEQLSLFPDEDSPSVSLKYSDILIGHSTLPFHVSYRGEEVGSCYLKFLHDVYLDNMDKDLEIRKLLQIVGRQVAGIMESGNGVQIPEIRDRLFDKNFYLIHKNTQQE